jgi:hypothetical protein
MERCPRCDRYDAAIRELKSYLQSSKFFEDTTVQTGDVLLRLDEMLMEPDDDGEA